jgi:hypothetical protein
MAGMAGTETHAPAAERPDPDAGFTDLLTADKRRHEKLVQMLRTRLQEVRQSLHTRLPVYIVLTKLDLLTDFLPGSRLWTVVIVTAFWESRLRVMPMKATTGVLN